MCFAQVGTTNRMASSSIKHYLVALNRYKWAGLTAFALILGASGLVAMRPEPPVDYVAEGKLTYLAPPITLSQTGTVLQQQGQALTRETLLSETVVNRVIERLRTQQILITPTQLRQQTQILITTDSPTSAVGGSSPPHLTHPASTVQVHIIYRSPNERIARTTTQLLMEAMVEQSRQFNSRQINSILDNLNQLLPRVTQELQAAEEALTQYVRREGPALQSAQDGQLGAAITRGQEQQRQVQLALAGVNAQIRSLESRLGLSADQAYRSSALSADPMIADLRARLYQVQMQIQMLTPSLRADHPRMVELRNQQQVLEQLLQQRVEEVLGSSASGGDLTQVGIFQGSSLDPARQQLANTLVHLQTQRATLEQQLQALVDLDQQLRQQYATLPSKQLEQSRLERQVTLRRAFYDQLQTRLADARLAAEETVGSLAIAQLPQSRPIADPGQNNWLIVALGALVGLGVAGGLVWLLDSLDAVLHSLSDLQLTLRQKQVPILGLLPQIPILPGETLPLLVEADTPYLEPYERLRVNLRRVGGDRAVKVVLVTSTTSGEGKTVTAYNLAIASARAGRRTLLLEADLRSPSLAPLLKVLPNPSNHVEPLRYYHRAEFALVPQIENLYILPGAGPQRQAAALLESSEMRRLMDDVRGRFDLVVIDTPALNLYNDALLLEPYTDGILLVTRPGYTEEGLLSEAIEQFQASEEIQLLGAVVNGADISIKSPQFEEDAMSTLRLDDLRFQTGLERLGSSSRNP